MHSDDETHSVDSDADAPFRKGFISDPEVWMDYWSEELVILWHGLQEHSQAMGAAVLDKCDFTDFAQFCWERSSRRPPAA